MIDVVEQRRLTDDFIRQYPVSVVLTPRDLVRTDSGGYKYVDGTARDPQLMTVVESPADPADPQVGADGKDIETRYELVAQWDAEIGPHDTFTVPGQTGTWQVVQLYFNNGWEARAAVTKNG